METISETNEASPPGGRHRVIRRVYKIQYSPQKTQQQTSNSSQERKSGSQRRSQHGSQRNRGSQRRMLQRGKSMKAFDVNTDRDIFALGSVFKDGDFSIDDFLKSWSSNAGHTGFKVQKVIRTTQDGQEEETTEDLTPEFLSQGTGVDIPAASVPGPGSSTISQLTSHQSSVFPFIRRQQRVVTTVLPESGGPAQRTVKTTVSTNDDSSEETYDNLSGQLQPLLPKQEEHFQPSPVMTGQYDTGPAQDRKPLIRHESESEATPNKDDVTPSDNVTDITSLQKKKGDTCIDIGESDTVTTSSASEAEISDQSKSYTTCPFYSPKKGKLRMLRGKGGPRGYADAGPKGKVGMTASEVPDLGQERHLPAVQQMVMNYNRMLEKNRDQFVETLFRAVKLNGVEVVKILCQLALRKDIKLSSDEMREPESSATVLHVALLYDHEEIVQYLISIRDCDLIMATYTKEEYKNQTALHVAVANGNQKLVNKLLMGLHRKDRKTLMNTVATGSYFQKNHPDGQLCLTAAAWAGNFDMLIILARHGISFTLKNIAGNTLMHQIVLSSVLYPEKMDYQLMVDKSFEAVGEWAKHCKYKSQIADQRILEQTQKQISTFQRLLNTRNNAGLTCLALASQCGSPLMQYLLNLEKIYKIPQTKLGSISWVTYDVTEVTTFTSDSYNKFSILHILAHNSKKLSRHSNIDPDSDAGVLDKEPIKTLVEMKWRVYRWVYIFWCLLHLFVHIAFTKMTFDVNSSPYPIYSEEGTPQNTDYDYYYEDQVEREIIGYHKVDVEPWYATFIILPTMYILLELVDLFGTYPYSICFMQNMSLLEKLTKRVKSEWVITGNGPYRMVMVAYSLFTIVWFIMYWNSSPNQNVALAMSLLLGWIFVLFFTRGCRVTSRFSIMIQKMFFRDLMYFLAVYIIVLMAFTFAMSAMYSHRQRANIYLPQIFYRLMNIVTELDQKTTLIETRYPLFTKMLLIMYAIVGVILLMNMLIAMMNTSYETVRITQCNLWKQQQLSIMLMLERRLFWIKCLCRRSESNVWQKEWEEGVKSYVDVTIKYF